MAVAMTQRRHTLHLKALAARRPANPPDPAAPAIAESDSPHVANPCDLSSGPETRAMPLRMGTVLQISRALP